MSWVKGAGAALFLYPLIEPHFLRVREFSIHLENLPVQAHGLRIVQMSDLHVGLYTPFRTVQKAIRKARELKPDLVVLTGDLVARRDSYHPRFVRGWAPPVHGLATCLASELRALTPRWGTWAIAGNHDLWQSSFVPIAQILARAGVASLVNESRKISGLKLVGVDDVRVGNPDFRGTFSAIKADEPQIILTHNPRYAALLKARNALILSGHTHGGQVRFPWRPIRAPVDASGIFWERGLFKIGRAQLYVSGGIGQVGFPVRMGVVPEIVVFQIN